MSFMPRKRSLVKQNQLVVDQFYGGSRYLGLGKSEKNRFIHLFMCKCERVFTKKYKDVKNAKRNDCGHCDMLEVTKHIHHQRWRNMIERCTNENSFAYKDYGGRGIKVCQRWLDSFWNFAEDIEEGWEEGLTLDRIDNNGDYEPGNVRWVDWSMQANNRRNNVEHEEIQWTGLTLDRTKEPKPEKKPKTEKKPKPSLDIDKEPHYQKIQKSVINGNYQKAVELHFRKKNWT